MDFNDLLTRFSGHAGRMPLEPAAVAPALDGMTVDFGLEHDRGRRFALRTPMRKLGTAPSLNVAFEDEADRNAAGSLMDLADQVSER